jgi:predicted ATPase
VLPAAPVLSQLLRASPHLLLLVTTRVALRLSGEVEFPVPPLSVPALDDLPPIPELAKSSAVALFVERAKAILPSFRLDEATAPSLWPSAPSWKVCRWRLSSQPREYGHCR